MSRLPRLLPNDSHNLLTEAQRTLVYEAIHQANIMRTKALQEIELAEMAETGRASLDISPGGGAAYRDFRIAVLNGVRVILKAEARAFRGAGLFGKQLREILTEETLESLVSSFELSGIERDLLQGELNLYRREYDLPEWLLVPAEAADSEISPLCKLSREGLKRLEMSRHQAEATVDILDRKSIARTSGQEDSEEPSRRLAEFGRNCVLAYSEVFGPPVFQEWTMALANIERAPRLLEQLSHAVVQLAIDHSRSTHRLHQVHDWQIVAQPAVQYLADLSNDAERRKKQHSLHVDVMQRNVALKEALPDGDDQPTGTFQATAPEDYTKSFVSVPAKGVDSAARGRRRISASVQSPIAARRMEAHAERMGMTEFASRVGTTDRTLRRFRSSGRIRRNILAQIAATMGMTVEDLMRE